MHQNKEVKNKYILRDILAIEVASQEIEFFLFATFWWHNDDDLSQRN